MRYDRVASSEDEEDVQLKATAGNLTPLNRTSKYNVTKNDICWALLRYKVL